ncbi:hypothetical protein FACS1894166_08980 [Bacilli bacterium]|nr:hypothetical protein FACS1894166_08980 [Bacilli bacterium]
MIELGKIYLGNLIAIMAGVTSIIRVLCNRMSKRHARTLKTYVFAHPEEIAALQTNITTAQP